MNTDTQPPAPQPAGLFRRLAAIVYDTALLFAILFLATAVLLPLSGGEAIAPHNPWFTTYLFLIVFFFFAWFWTHGGQTLGMRAWRLRVQQPNGQAITLWQALLRFLTAMVSWGVLGLGFLWVWIDPKKRTWHDRFSETVTVLVPKPAARSTLQRTRRTP